jgi:hypothetical protein
MTNVQVFIMKNYTLDSRPLGLFRQCPHGDQSSLFTILTTKHENSASISCCPSNENQTKLDCHPRSRVEDGLTLNGSSLMGQALIGFTLNGFYLKGIRAN